MKNEKIINDVHYIFSHHNRKNGKRKIRFGTVTLSLNAHGKYSDGERQWLDQPGSGQMNVCINVAE